MLGDERRERRRCSPGRRPRGTSARRSAAYSAGASAFRSTASVVAPARRERGDDVDALAGAGEEDDRHGAEGYSGRALDSAANVSARQPRRPRSSPARPARTASTSSQRLLADGWTVHAAVRDVEAAEAVFGGHERLRAVRRDIRDPGPAARARRRRAAGGALQPGRREQRRRLVRRPAGDVGVERARRRPPARRDPARQPGDALLPGLVGRDVRLGARRERRPRRVVGAQPAEPVRGGEGRRAHALPAATASRTGSGSRAGSSSTTSRAAAARSSCRGRSSTTCTRCAPARPAARSRSAT